MFQIIVGQNSVYNNWLTIKKLEFELNQSHPQDVEMQFNIFLLLIYKNRPPPPSKLLSLLSKQLTQLRSVSSFASQEPQNVLIKISVLKLQCCTLFATSIQFLEQCHFSIILYYYNIYWYFKMVLIIRSVSVSCYFSFIFSNCAQVFQISVKSKFLILFYSSFISINDFFFVALTEFQNAFSI